MDKLLFKRILVAALTILALIYVTYLLMSANFNMYPTENAVEATVSNSIRTDALIIRNETIINNDSDGILSYTISNGESVDANGEIAKVYSKQEDAVANSLADSLQRRILSLKDTQKSARSGAVSVDVINNNIHSNLLSYLYDVNRFDVDAVKTDADKLLTSINQRQLLTGKITSFDDQINSLTAQMDYLRDSSGESIDTVTTPKAGCFTEFCDGYENAYPYAKVDEMTLADFRSIQKGAVPENAAGKVVSDVKWYVVCEITSDQAAAMSVYDGTITVLFTEASTDPIPAKLRRVRRDDSGQALAILECDFMDSSLLEARRETIEIGMGSYTGLRVTKRAIHDDFVTKTTYDENNKPHKEQKKVQGVYVLYGSEVQFKQIAILYATKDYVICDTSPQEGTLFNGETISLYDKVIVKGDDLYDGKVIS
ncbi:MAG: hypothetical protein II127_06470 [Ruminococcus sp.]|nr:hypothetical protein [Ruminococcus sp.]